MFKTATTAPVMVTMRAASRSAEQGALSSFSPRRMNNRPTLEVTLADFTTVSQCSQMGWFTSAAVRYCCDVMSST